MWHQLNVRSYVNYKIHKFRFDKVLYIWLEFFIGNGFLQNTRRHSENILTGVLENCWRELQGKEEEKD